ncbi:hypothetical protein BS329_15670 [Amycolatopsis coloradensis]|uniref:GGDEF domain-containing protein n=1 Tax=Amycolatopsis coloradensis TaxID=76021 RepID=A0A1R0KUC7_9PSEU|nr:GGDEF domain-containing protein [Amycolatopsis coloradensis]OLZ51701.1 hypothetical protein BS329_15670 [Amycolatopsis coloradensis]
MSRARNGTEARSGDDSCRSKDRLRSLSGPTVAAVVVIDLAGLAAIAYGWLASRAPQQHHWILFALFVGAALTHMALTRPSEERRRDARLVRGKVEFVDQTSLWFASAALVLPTTLALGLVVIVRTRRYFVARKPLGLWTSSTATVVLAVVGVGIARDLVDARTWLSHTITFDTAAGGRAVIVMTVAVAVYFLSEAVPIGIYRGIRWRKWRLADMIGTWEDNKLLLHTLALGMAAALVAVALPLGLLVILAIAVRDTRNIGRIAALETEGEQHRTDALTDPLTGLPNRRGFTALASAAVEIDHANGRPTAMLMLDLDYFKRWNTLLGHPGGDKVLTALAAVLRRETRVGDLLARMGGEEMAVVLPGTNWTTAIDVAERIRAAVQNLDTEIIKPAGGALIRLGHNGIPRCTISIGIAASPEQGATLTELETYSDQALEAAKTNGRNQVVALAMLTSLAETTNAPAPAPAQRQNTDEDAVGKAFAEELLALNGQSHVR